MKSKNIILALALCLLLLPPSLLKAEGKFSGLVFGDYYYALAKPRRGRQEQQRLLAAAHLLHLRQHPDRQVSPCASAWK